MSKSIQNTHEWRIYFPWRLTAHIPLFVLACTCGYRKYSIGCTCTPGQYGSCSPTYQKGEYGAEGIYIGVPAVVGEHGVSDILTLKLNEEEQAKFDKSASVLKEIIENTINPLLEGKD